MALMILQFGSDVYCYFQYRTRGDLGPSVVDCIDFFYIGLVLGFMTLARLLFKSFEALDFAREKVRDWRRIIGDELVSAMLLQATVESIPFLLINRHVVSSLTIEQIDDTGICFVCPLISMATIFLSLQVPSELNRKYKRRHVPLATICFICFTRVCLLTARIAFVYFAAKADYSTYKISFVLLCVLRVLVIGTLIELYLPKIPDSFQQWFRNVGGAGLLTAYSLLTPILNHDSKDGTRWRFQMFVADQITLMMMSSVLSNGEQAGKNRIFPGNREVQLLSAFGLILLGLVLRMFKTSRSNTVTPVYSDYETA